jgi:hypothetical protein
MKVVGSGNTGCKLGVLFDENPILLSTAEQDSANFKGHRVHNFNDDGCGKKYGTGFKLWNTKLEDLENALKDITNDQVVVFSSLGGGSGSSSLQFISRILLEQGNDVLIAGVLPFKKEVVPPLANAVQSINSLIPLINDVSIMLFDNQTLLKEYDNDWTEVNASIIEKVNYAVNLITKHSGNGYSPMTIDKSELESVVFGGGFLDVSDSFLEERAPKFQFGRLDKETKNVLIAMFVDQKVHDSKMDEYHKILTGVQSKFAGRARNARMVPGIIRGRILESNSESGISDRAYVTIASGLNIDSYSAKIAKLRDEAVEKATAFSTRQKGKSIVTSKESKVLDI